MKDRFQVYRRKMAVWMVSGMLMVSAAATGCGQKKVDYDINNTGEETVNESPTGQDANGDSGKLATNYGIPESCRQSIDPVDCGLDSIEIAVDQIRTIDTAELIAENYKKRERTPEYKKKAVNAVFDRDIQLSGDAAKTKAEVQVSLDAAKQEYEEAKEREAAGEPIYEQQYIDEIKWFENQLEHAPEEAGSVGDYSANLYKGIRNNIEFELGFPCAEYPMAHFKMIQDLIQYRPKDGAAEADMIQLPMMTIEEYKKKLTESMDSSAGNSSVQDEKRSTEKITEAEVHENMCAYSVDEAKIIADDFLADLEISNIMAAGVSDLMWAYYDDEGVPSGSIEYDGYIFLYSRAVGTQLAASYDYGDMDAFSDGDSSLDIPHESYTVYVNGDGVIYASWKDYMEPTGVSEPVSILPFDELLKKAAVTIPEAYKLYKTQYKSVTFNHLELGYCLQQTEEKGIYRYAPTWIFSSQENADETHEDSYTSQLVILDASTGERIDPVALSDSLNIAGDEEWKFDDED